MNVLVTGANGFVGRPLCTRLLKEARLVRGAVRSMESAALLPAGVVAVPVGPVGPDTDWSKALAGIDTVIHLAARVHMMKEGRADPLAVYRHVNVAGTERLARMASAHGVRRLVFLSSVKVHGEEAATPYTENDRLAPADPYGVSKLEAELALRRVSAETGLEVVILRPPLVYGPGVRANFFRLLKLIERGLPLPLACIENRRSLIYVGNLVDAILTCAVRPEASGGRYLVSDGEDVSTPELIRLLGTALGRRARLWPLRPSLLSLAGRIGGKQATVDRLVGSLVVDSGKIRRELGWKAPFSLGEGIRETVAWYGTIVHEGDYV